MKDPSVLDSSEGPGSNLESRTAPWIGCQEELFSGGVRTCDTAPISVLSVLGEAVSVQIKIRVCSS